MELLSLPLVLCLLRLQLGPRLGWALWLQVRFRPLWVLMASYRPKDVFVSAVPRIGLARYCMLLLLLQLRPSRLGSPYAMQCALHL